LSHSEVSVIGLGYVGLPVVATSREEFLELSSAEFPVRVFVDGRNSFNKQGFTEAGIIYKGIGN